MGQGWWSKPQATEGQLSVKVVFDKHFTALESLSGNAADGRAHR
jgi:hypothetical protein